MCVFYWLDIYTFTIIMPKLIVWPRNFSAAVKRFKKRWLIFAVLNAVGKLAQEIGSAAEIGSDS